MCSTKGGQWNRGLHAAAKKIFDKKVGCLVVDVDRLVGTITERDIVTKAAACSVNPLTVCISAIMTSKVITCTMQAETPKTKRIMDRCGTRHPHPKRQLISGVGLCTELLACVLGIARDGT